MDFPIQTVSNVIMDITNNWEVISVSILAIVAGFDKVALIVIRTLGNIRDEWYAVFPGSTKTPDPPRD
jgi:hypothetical protein